MPSESAAVKVVARVRPLSSDEVAKGVKAVTKTEGNKVTVEAAGKDSSFFFDGAFSADAKNQQIYQSKVDTYTKRALEGYNVAVLAFGATGGGKSYLMAGTEEDPGIVPCLNRSLYKCMGEKTVKEFFVSVSYVEILDEQITDLLNPHTRTMKIRQHPQKGIYVEGLSEFVVKGLEDLERLYEQGNRARKGGATDLRAHRERAHAIFTITVEQKERQSSKMGVRAKIQLVDLAGIESGSSTDASPASKGVRAVLEVISALGERKKKGGHVPYRDSLVTRLLQDALGGNAFSLLFAVLSPSDKAYRESLSTLEYASFVKSITNQVKMNLDDTSDIISELRVEISKLRDKIATSSDPNKDDVLKMEDLVQDLQIAKKQTWQEQERRSTQYEQERKVNLANKGIYEWVMDSMKKGNRETQETIILLQKEKDQLTVKLGEKRKIVEELKEDLQKKITDYSKMAESGKANESETKKKVTAIHETKERLKRESEAMKEMKQQLKDIQDKQKEEKEGGTAQITVLKGNMELRQKIEREEREKMETENRAMIADELENMKLEVENAKTEIELKVAEGQGQNARDMADLEIRLAEHKAEKAVVTLRLQTLEQEKAKLAENVEGLYKVHKDEMEIQQLQHYQTFRQYRQMFEEQKAAIEQRYRRLLEDAVQDAVFLSTRNEELLAENQLQGQQMGELKDVITKLGGRLPAATGSITN